MTSGYFFMFHFFHDHFYFPGFPVSAGTLVCMFVSAVNHEKKVYVTSSAFF